MGSMGVIFLGQLDTANSFFGAVVGSVGNFHGILCVQEGAGKQEHEVLEYGVHGVRFCD